MLRLKGQGPRKQSRVMVGWCADERRMKLTSILNKTAGKRREKDTTKGRVSSREKTQSSERPECAHLLNKIHLNSSSTFWSMGTIDLPFSFAVIFVRAPLHHHVLSNIRQLQCTSLVYDRRLFFSSLSLSLLISFIFAAYSCHARLSCY